MDPELSYEFGPFRVEPARQRLLCNGDPVALAPKAFETLLVLVERPGDVVEKDELMRRVWPDTIVEEANVTQNIFVLRKVLGDDKNGRRCIATVPGRGYRFVAELRSVRQASIGNVRPRATKAISGSIAVLPFTLLGGDVEEYLGLGMADAVIARLSRVRQVVVRPTSAVQRYVGQRICPAEVGRQLKVDSVMEGTIQRSGDRIRVTVQLVDVRTGAALWAEHFDESGVDLFAVHDSVPERVSETLQLELSVDERNRMRRRYTDNSEAYRLHLMGRYYLDKRTRQGVKKAFECFQQALDQDPSYALAHAGLADCYIVMTSYFGELSPQEAATRCLAHVTRALEIDETLPGPHAALGMIHFGAEWNWAAAEREYTRALALDPNCGTAHNWYALLLACIGELDECVAEARRAVDVDPLSLTWNAGLGYFLYLARRYDQAIEQALKTLDMDANCYVAHYVLGLSYEQHGRIAEAIGSLERAVASSGSSPFMQALLGRVYGLAGRRPEAMRVLDDLNEPLRHKYVAPELKAFVHAGLGNTDRAFELLEEACAGHSCNLVLLKTSPLFDTLRSDMRFQHLLQRVGLATA